MHLALYGYNDLVCARHFPEGLYLNHSWIHWTLLFRLLHICNTCPIFFFKVDAVDSSGMYLHTNVLKKNWNTLFDMERQGNTTESSPRQHVSWSGGSRVRSTRTRPLKSPKDILENILKKQKSVQSIREHYPHFYI